MAVTVGFEPTVACTTLAFEASSFGRSDTSPPMSVSQPGPADKSALPSADHDLEGSDPVRDPRRQVLDHPDVVETVPPALRDSVAYGLLRSDFETGRTTPLVWDDLKVRFPGREPHPRLAPILNLSTPQPSQPALPRFTCLEACSQDAG